MVPQKRGLTIGSHPVDVLYLGYEAQRYARSFLPLHFPYNVLALDLPNLRSKHSDREIKKSVLHAASNGLLKALVLAPEYDPFFFHDELLRLKNQCILGLVFGDDTHCQYSTSELASVSDFVLTTDPTQLARYRELGVPCFLHLFDITPSRFPVWNVRREIDLLIYGTKAKKRARAIEALKDRFCGVKIVDISDTRVDDGTLARLLRASRVTVNWSSVQDQAFLNNYKDPLATHYLQFKGRVIEASLSGVLCVSQSFPGRDLIFGEGALPTFDEQEDLFDLVAHFLSDESDRRRQTKLAYSRSIEYLHKIQVPIELFGVKRTPRNIPPEQHVDEITSTWAMREAIKGLRSRPLESLSNAFHARPHRVNWTQLKHLI